MDASLNTINTEFLGSYFHGSTIAWYFHDLEIRFVPLCSTQHRVHGCRRRGANRWEANSSEAEQSELSVDGPKSRLNIWSICTAAFYCMVINQQIPKSHIRAQNLYARPSSVFTCIKSNTNITRLL